MLTNSCAILFAKGDKLMEDKDAPEVQPEKIHLLKEKLQELERLEQEFEKLQMEKKPLEKDLRAVKPNISKAMLTLSLNTVQNPVTRVNQVKVASHRKITLDTYFEAMEQMNGLGPDAVSKVKQELKKRRQDLKKQQPIADLKRIPVKEKRKPRTKNPPS